MERQKSFNLRRTLTIAPVHREKHRRKLTVVAGPTLVQNPLSPQLPATALGQQTAISRQSDSQLTPSFHNSRIINNNNSRTSMQRAHKADSNCTFFGLTNSTKKQGPGHSGSIHNSMTSLGRNANDTVLLKQELRPSPVIFSKLGSMNLAFKGGPAPTAASRLQAAQEYFSQTPDGQQKVMFSPNFGSPASKPGSLAQSSQPASSSKKIAPVGIASSRQSSVALKKQKSTTAEEEKLYIPAWNAKVLSQPVRKEGDMPSREYQDSAKIVSTNRGQAMVGNDPFARRELSTAGGFSDHRATAIMTNDEGTATTAQERLTNHFHAEDSHAMTPLNGSGFVKIEGFSPAAQLQQISQESINDDLDEYQLTHTDHIFRPENQKTCIHSVTLETEETEKTVSDAEKRARKARELALFAQSHRSATLHSALVKQRKELTKVGKSKPPSLMSVGGPKPLSSAARPLIQGRLKATSSLKQNLFYPHAVSTQTSLVLTRYSSQAAASAAAFNAVDGRKKVTPKDLFLQTQSSGGPMAATVPHAAATSFDFKSARKGIKLNMSQKRLCETARPQHARNQILATSTPTAKSANSLIKDRPKPAITDTAKSRRETKPTFTNHLQKVQFEENRQTTEDEDVSPLGSQVDSQAEVYIPPFFREQEGDIGIDFNQARLRKRSTFKRRRTTKKPLKKLMVKTKSKKSSAKRNEEDTCQYTMEDIINLQRSTYFSALNQSSELPTFQPRQPVEMPSVDAQPLEVSFRKFVDPSKESHEILSERSAQAKQPLSLGSNPVKSPEDSVSDSSSDEAGSDDQPSNASKSPLSRSRISRAIKVEFQLDTSLMGSKMQHTERVKKEFRKSTQLQINQSTADFLTPSYAIESNKHSFALVGNVSLSARTRKDSKRRRHLSAIIMRHSQSRENEGSLESGDKSHGHVDHLKVVVTPDRGSRNSSRRGSKSASRRSRRSAVRSQQRSIRSPIDIHEQDQSLQDNFIESMVAVTKDRASQISKDFTKQRTRISKLRKNHLRSREQSQESLDGVTSRKASLEMSESIDSVASLSKFVGEQMSQLPRAGKLSRVSSRPYMEVRIGGQPSVKEMVVARGQREIIKQIEQSVSLSKPLVPKVPDLEKHALTTLPLNKMQTSLKVKPLQQIQKGLTITDAKSKALLASQVSEDFCPWHVIPSVTPLSERDLVCPEIRELFCKDRETKRRITIVDSPRAARHGHHYQLELLESSIEKYRQMDRNFMEERDYSAFKTQNRLEAFKAEHCIDIDAARQQRLDDRERLQLSTYDSDY